MKLVFLFLFLVCSLAGLEGLVFNALNMGMGGDVMDKISMANAEMLALREEKSFQPVKALLRCSREKMMEKPSLLGGLLEREGAISIPNVLSTATCDKVLAYINAENIRAKDEVTKGDVPFDYRFGGVNCRGLNGMFGCRQDQFLPSSSPEVKLGLVEAINVLKPLLQETITDDGMIHEISSFVADPGSLPFVYVSLLIGPNLTITIS